VGVDEKTLTPEQAEAAKMVGHGMQYADVSRALGGTPSAATIGRWNRELDEFREAADKAREEDMLSEPEAVAALRDALRATDGRGNPDHKTRVVAAKALLSRRGIGGGVKQSGKVRETTIYVNPEGDGDGEGS
jgi:hypothetical protein